MHKKYFKGNIFYKSHESKSVTKPFMDYEAPLVDPAFSQTLMGQFNKFNFTNTEKSKLSVAHRKLLAQFKDVNIFNLKIEVKNFINQLSEHRPAKIEIHAEGYGAFIALAAIYSGEIPKDKSVEFYFSNMPIALFPKTLTKAKSVPRNCKMTFKIEPHSWIEPFSTLMGHNEIKCKILKAS